MYFCTEKIKNMKYQKVLKSIRKDVKEYLLKNNIKSLIIGVSGGMDSAMNCFILRPICDELDIKLYGRYIHIESNKQEERDRALLVGNTFCDEFDSIDLTSLYKESLLFYDEGESPLDSFRTKIGRGNIKARMRMIHLYNLAHEMEGIVIDNDNKTEHELGFWTLHGDVGDITPMAELWKSDIYNLAKYVINFCKISDDEKRALSECIEAVPTDGLGITSSDLEQFGAKSYYQVDEILKEYNKFFFYLFGIKKMIKKHGEDVVNKIVTRHIKSNFKRNHPFRIKL